VLCRTALRCAALHHCTRMYIYIYIHTYQHVCLPDIPGRYPPSPRPIPSHLISSHARGPDARLIPNATEPCVETPPSNNGNHNHNQNQNHNHRKTKHDMQIKTKIKIGKNKRRREKGSGEAPRNKLAFHAPKTGNVRCQLPLRRCITSTRTPTKKNAAKNKRKENRINHPH
jgi:hypothetical protein